MKAVKNLIVLLLISFSSFAQINAPNIGFENGTFDNWECAFGTIDTLGTVVVYQSSPVQNMFTIFGRAYASVVDPFGKFPVLSPNGSNYSIMLGDTIRGNTVQRISYTLTVPSAGSNSIIFNYAVVLQNPTHLYYQQPKFTLQVFDVTDNKYLDCPAFNFIASGNLPGFRYTPGDIYCKDWSTATIDLKNLNGKTIRLEFTVNHCSFGYHFGYAYLDVNENISSPISGNAYCIGQRSVTLTAPPGFATYQWYNADLTKALGAGQKLTLSPPPPDLSKFAVQITPYNGLGCADTLFTVVNKIDQRFKLSVPDTVSGCPGSGVDLTAAAVTAGSSPGMVLSYFTDSLAANYLAGPANVTKPGLYYIQGINADGCTNILPVQVTFGLPVITVTDPSAVTYPAAIDLSKTFAKQPGVSYGYYGDAGATIAVQNYSAVIHTGTYYIKGTNAAGCSTIAPVNITVSPPSYVISAPNTFTPNNDGVNDHFAVNIKGYITFIRTRIYNRYGTLIYTAKSPDDTWDGKLNGQNLPAGTYYWIFEGIDNYYNRQVKQAASITLIR